MQLKYVDTKEEIIAINRKSKHIEPHLHNALEIVCVTSGALELGVGQELYHMEKGDIGFVFPDVIHHYQLSFTLSILDKTKKWNLFSKIFHKILLFFTEILCYTNEAKYNI